MCVGKGLGRGIDANMGARCMRGLNSSFPAPMRTMATGDSASGLPRSSSGKNTDGKFEIITYGTSPLLLKHI